MNKRIILTLTLVCTIALTGCGGAGKKTESVSKNTETKATETLIVGFDQAFPPMGFKDSNGNYTGFDIELAQLAAQKINMNIKLQPIDWGSKDAEINSGNINCIWNGFTMTGREGKYEFSKPYMVERQVLVVKKDSLIKSLADMKGKTLEIQQSSTADNALNADKDFGKNFGNIIRVPDNLSALSDLEQGSCDAVMMDEIIARYALKQGKLINVIPVENKALKDGVYAVGFKLGNKELAEKIDQALRELNKEGKLRELSRKYFGEDITIYG